MPKPDIFHSKEDFLSSTVVHKGKIMLPLSLTTSEDGDLSPVPPSYKSTVVEPTLPAAPLRTNKGRYSQTESLFSGKKIVSVPKGRPKPTVDLDEAWKNIKMEQDEKYADEFRDNLLLTRCWDIWRQGYLWIIVSGFVFNQACSADRGGEDHSPTDSRSSKQVTPQGVYAKMARSYNCSKGSGRQACRSVLCQTAKTSIHSLEGQVQSKEASCMEGRHATEDEDRQTKV